MLPRLSHPILRVGRGLQEWRKEERVLGLKMQLRDVEAGGSNLLNPLSGGSSLLDSSFLRREEGFPDGSGSGDGRWTMGGAISKTLPLRRNVNPDCPCDVSR